MTTTSGIEQNTDEHREIRELWGTTQVTVRAGDENKLGIGAGGYQNSEVHVWRGSMSGQDVAVKEMKVPKDAKSGFLVRLATEFYLAKSLPTGRHVVHTHEVFRVADSSLEYDTFFHVMELFAGVELYELIETKIGEHPEFYEGAGTMVLVFNFCRAICDVLFSAMLICEEIISTGSGGSQHCLFHAQAPNVIQGILFEANADLPDVAMPEVSEVYALMDWATKVFGEDEGSVIARRIAVAAKDAAAAEVRVFFFINLEHHLRSNGIICAQEFGDRIFSAGGAYRFLPPLHRLLPSASSGFLPPSGTTSLSHQASYYSDIHIHDGTSMTATCPSRLSQAERN